MVKTKNLKKEFPSVLDIAYKRHLRDLSRYKEVKAIMSEDIATISPETSMEDAAKIMGEKHIGSLIVTKYETPVGIITERDLLTKVLAKGKDIKEEKIENVMSYPLISICMTAKIKEAARIMIKKKGRLAVFECGKLAGIVTASDLIRSLPDVPETEIKVDNFMTKQLVTADEKQPLGKVVKTMGEQRIGSVIVTRNTIPTGIFTERDLLTTILATGKSLSTLVGDHSSSPLVTIDEGTSIHKAAVTMKTKHIRRLPIIRGEKLTGIITARDLVEAYAK
jgi:CBS domain-containing protein